MISLGRAFSGKGSSGHGGVIGGRGKEGGEGKGSGGALREQQTES